MSDKEGEQKFVDQVRRVLDRSVDELDGAMRARLARARAMAQAPRARHAMPWWPVTGLAIAAGVGALAWVLWFAAPAPTGAPGLENLDLLTAGDSLELYSDLEFYSWLAGVQDAG